MYVMPLTRVAFLLVLAGCAKSPCDYAQPRCGANQVCAFVKKGDARCISYAEEAAEVAAPFRPGTAFWCSQGGRSAAGRTHSFGGDVYALDLASPDEGEVEVTSPMDGVAYVFDGCDERRAERTATNNSTCGLGYGNHVRIWNGRDIYLLGHFARVRVKPGRVRRGEVLGVMGCSGAAGHRHIHLSVTRPQVSDDIEKLLATPGWKAELPVRFRLSAHSAEGAAIDSWSDAYPCADEAKSAVLAVP